MVIVICGFENVSELITANKDIVRIASILLSLLKKVPSVMTANILNGRKKTMQNNKQKIDSQEMDGGQNEYNNNMEASENSI